MNDEFNINIFKKLIEINFEYSKLQNSIDSDYFKNLQQIHILTNQFLSFYKVTFVEEGIDKLDIVTVSILTSFVNLMKEYSKNIESSQSKINSMDYIIESMERLLSFFVKEKADLLKL